MFKFRRTRRRHRQLAEVPITPLILSPPPSHASRVPPLPIVTLQNPGEPHSSGVVPARLAHDPTHAKGFGKSNEPCQSQTLPCCPSLPCAHSTRIPPVLSPAPPNPSPPSLQAPSPPVVPPPPPASHVDFCDDCFLHSLEYTGSGREDEQEVGLNV